MNIYYVSRKPASEAIPASITQWAADANWTHFTLPEVSIVPLWKNITDEHTATAKQEVQRLNAEAPEAIVVDDLKVLATITLAQLPIAPIALILPETLTQTMCKCLKRPLVQAACQLTLRVIAPNEAVKEEFRAAIGWQTKSPRFLPAITCPAPNAPLFEPEDFTRPLPANIVKAWREGKLEFIGGGSRRQCYRIPWENLCIKCYRLDLATATRLKPSVHAEIGRMRHNRAQNTSCQEFDYFEQKVTQASPKVVAIFPNVLELIYLPECGWTLIEELLLNYDGSYVKHCEECLRQTTDPALRKAIFDAIIQLKDDILKYNIKLYDPQNLLIQFTDEHTFQVRLSDFEPANRTLIKLDELSPIFIRRKTARRCNAFLQRLALYL